jgi:pilus assembly protein Flp/PilA
LKQARRIELKSFAWKATGLRSGVTAIECGLIAAGIGVAILTVVNSVGGSLVAIFTTVSNDLPFELVGRFDARTALNPLCPAPRDDRIGFAFRGKVGCVMVTRGCRRWPLFVWRWGFAVPPREGTIMSSKLLDSDRRRLNRARLRATHCATERLEPQMATSGYCSKRISTEECRRG